MEKQIKIWCALVFMLLYCSAISNAKISLPESCFYSQSTRTKTPYNVTPSIKVFHGVAPSEAWIDFFPTFSSSSSIKESYKKTFAFGKTEEQDFLNKFVQYRSFSRNLLIQLRKTELLFPFDYFW